VEQEALLELEAKDPMDFLVGNLLYLPVEQEEEQLVLMLVEEMEEKELMVVAVAVAELVTVHRVAPAGKVEMV
jgi:hypothetical protein